RVLDVACGTGVVAREVADRLGAAAVVGVDLNQAMLAVARRLRPDIAWRQADAAALPFADDSFDAVLCQAALMFFPDRAGALREMVRVAKPHGKVVAQVWDDLGRQPAYGPFVEVVADRLGAEAKRVLDSYWVLGDIDLVRALFEAAGLEVTEARTHLETARFPSVEEMLRAEIEATPLIDRISDEDHARVLADAGDALRGFEREDGTADIPVGGHVVVGRKR
ncbi:MAG TPA: class I SAM-dependent methyltransferase, partial [Actinomycetota bacterium]|nr:class I SAM-dependent methyltransferase [Actinomycetota bacterium]